MWRLGQLRPVHLAVACVTWAALVVLLPRLTLLAVVLHFRVRAILSPATERGVAFGGAHWVSLQSMLAVMAVPPALLVCAWILARLLHRGSAP
jgi:hypothetical protein